MPQTEVILRYDGAELARATLPPGEYVIGREAGVDLRANTPLLSRKHARLTINYDHLLLEDLGSSNGTFVNEQPLPVNEVARLFPNQSIRLGPDIIHRDLKPENLMLGDFGSVLVMDWGLAKIIGRDGASARDAGRSAVFTVRAAEPALSATMTGSIMGTPAYTGTSAREIVENVARGKIEWTPAKPETARQRTPIPASLLAVVRRAMAFEKAARYRHVEDFQTDLLAYQNGFATSAEQAGAWKQFTLFVKRNKAASIGAAAVLLVGGGFGTKAVFEGRRAERALTDLKKTAPALRQLAESEARFQRFDSALLKLEAAIRLDPSYLPSYWRRAWLYLRDQRFTDAATAIRVAQQKDTDHGDLAAILPTLENLAALPAAAPWPQDTGRKLYEHLVKVRASGEVVAIAPKIRLSAEEHAKLIRQRLTEWLGNDRGVVEVDKITALVKVRLDDLAIDTVEPLQKLQI